MERHQETSDSVFARHGNSVVVLTDEQDAAFTETVRPLFDEWGKTTDELELNLLLVIYDSHGWDWISNVNLVCGYICPREKSLLFFRHIVTANLTK